VSGNKMKNGKLVLVGVKTTIHLFTYSLSGNKIKKVDNVFLVGVKTTIHLFTYSLTSAAV
jgi:hypothetical protein